MPTNTTTSPHEVTIERRPTGKVRIYSLTGGPNRETEDVVSYYETARPFFQKNFGRAPCRTTLFKYLENGFPIRKGGPYVRIPALRELDRPITTVQAMRRFLTLVRVLQRECKVLPSA